MLLGHALCTCMLCTGCVGDVIFLRDGPRALLTPIPADRACDWLDRTDNTEGVLAEWFTLQLHRL